MFFQAANSVLNFNFSLTNTIPENAHNLLRLFLEMKGKEQWRFKVCDPIILVFFSSELLVGFRAWTACFRFFHNISIGLRAGLLTQSFQNITFLMLLFLGRTTCVFRVVLLLHFLFLLLLVNTLTFFCRICLYNSEIIAPLMIALQNRPKSWCCHHHVSQMG